MPFFDLQVNGYAGADFNGDRLSDEQVLRAAQQLHADGVAGILATVITDDLPAMCRRLTRLATLREENADLRAMIHGFHIEGPFLNPQPGYIGAHPAQAACAADRDKMEPLLAAAGGATRIVTLAPECDPGLRLTRWLADQGIVVSAGHCNPTLDQLKAAIDQGLTMITHLGNGCPLEIHRHENIIQRALHFALSLVDWLDCGWGPCPAVCSGKLLAIRWHRTMFRRDGCHFRRRPRPGRISPGRPDGDRGSTVGDLVDRPIPSGGFCQYDAAVGRQPAATPGTGRKPGPAVDLGAASAGDWNRER